MIELDATGELLAIDAGEELLILERGDTGKARATVTLPGLRAFALVGDELWCAAADRGALALIRVGLDGTRHGSPAPLDGKSGRLVAARQDAAAIWIGPQVQLLRREGERIVVEGLGPGVEVALPLGGDLRLEARAGELFLRRGGSELRLGELEGAVRDGAALANGAAVLLVGEGAAAVVLVVDGREALVRHRIPVAGATTLRAAWQRGWVVVRVGTHELRAFDAGTGRLLRVWREATDVLDFGVDGAGRWLALFCARGTDGELLCRPLGALEPRPRNLPPLHALSPRPAPPALSTDEVAAILAAQREQVGAWCERAIADGWDTGRLGFPGGELPFEGEVDALVGPARGRATARTERARAREATLRPFDRHSGDATPLGQLAGEFGLSPLARRALLAIAAPSLWGELARLYAIVANDKGRRLCDEFLVSQLLGSDPHAVARELDPGGPLVESGLVIVGAGSRPFAELRVDPIVVRRLRAETFLTTDPFDVVELRRPDRTVDQLAVAPEPVDQLIRALAAAPGGPLRAVLHGRLGTGRRALLAALAAHAGRPLGLLDVGRLSTEGAELPSRLAVELRRIVLRGWLPCISGLDHLPSEAGAMRDQLRGVLRDHPGPLLLRTGSDAALPLDPGHVAINFPLLDEDRRAAFWREALERHHLDPSPSDRLASMYRVGPGIIEAVVGRARATDGDSLLEDLRAALRQHRDGQIGAVANRVRNLPSWENVALPPEVLDSIREFIGRIRHRRVVYDAWGFHRIMTSSRGLTALFMGGPGTGKTMVAGLIARELGFDLYRVDLSRVLSKWIGETEKHLGAVFDAAEDGQVVLVFDEADSLFARRTEVKTSVDRYANVEVNFLLQRLDAFEGIAILTTNLATSIDAAFKRRLSIRLTFPFPDEEMREQLWRAHLPPELPIQGKLDLAALAKRHQLSGGYIRNAALRAAFLAAEEGTPLTQAHLERAVTLEYREMGKIVEGGVLE